MILNRTTGRVLLLGVLCLGGLEDVACSRHAGVPATPFPASNEVAGWVKTGDTRTFSAMELWSYIDGDAERYVKAGVQTTSTADYNFQNTVDAVVDIYTMGSAQGARTIFEGEPASQTKSVQVGDSGRLYTGSLVFWRGNYLVRIVAYKQSSEVQTALQALGHGIERRLSE
ncbi:MAG: DUF6599 family protein [Candidatus Sulfotelmatobacter sp.]|jgi:hypothetical protein